MDKASLNKVKLTKFIKVINGDIQIYILQPNINNYSQAVDKANNMQDCFVSNMLLHKAPLVHKNIH